MNSINEKNSNITIKRLRFIDTPVESIDMQIAIPAVTNADVLKRIYIDAPFNSLDYMYRSIRDYEEINALDTRRLEVNKMTYSIACMNIINLMAKSLPKNIRSIDISAYSGEIESIFRVILRYPGEPISINKEYIRTFIEAGVSLQMLPGDVQDIIYNDVIAGLKHEMQRYGGST